MLGVPVKTHIRRYYTTLFTEPRSLRLPIKTGRELAESLGYPVDRLPFVSDRHWERFFPCGNLLPLLRPSPGDRLLNLGCGVAVDSFMLQALHGDSLSIINLDIVFAALLAASGVKVGTAAAPPGPGSLCWICGDGEGLPLRGEAFDWVMLNGVLNLFPDKTLVLGEIRRVLKPGGLLVGADLCAAAALPGEFHDHGDAWAWCMSGAYSPAELLDLFESCRLRPLRIEPQAAPDCLYPVLFACRKATADQPMEA